jgi:hypothetical protein
LLAGSLFGLLVYKPHLGIMIPIALIAGGRWKAIAAAAIVGGAAIALSGAIFGIDVWSAYLHNLGLFRRAILEDGTGVWHRMVSVFVFARRLGFEVSHAYAIQAVAALCGAVLVAAAWRRGLPSSIRNSALVVATLLATPYLQDYDLVVCAFVAAWIMGRSAESQAGTISAFICVSLLLILPVVAAPFGAATGYAIGPLFILPAFGWLAVSVLTSQSRRDNRAAGEGAAREARSRG